VEEMMFDADDDESLPWSTCFEDEDEDVWEEEDVGERDENGIGENILAWSGIACPDEEEEK